MDSVDHLQNLLQMSLLNLFVSNNEEMIGFIICFKENSNYSSKNYKFFSDNENNFLYIDRVVIKEEYRRKGIANHLYSLIEKLANDS